MSPSPFPEIHGLHHNAWRCSDSERTRQFHEDLLGLPLTDAFELKAQHDFDLRIALEVDEAALQPMLECARSAGVEVRGITDHGFIHSIYLRDPDGYVVELTAPVAGVAPKECTQARRALDEWQRRKAAYAVRQTSPQGESEPSRSTA